MSPEREARFWAKVTPSGDCWEWTAYRNAGGYGWFSVAPSTSALAHRVAYELLVGPIPEGLVLDHLCQNRWCVNPYHLDPVTDGVNVRRGVAATKTACKNGHEYTPENTHRDGKGARRCRTCNRDRGRANWAARSH